MRFLFICFAIFASAFSLSARAQCPQLTGAYFCEETGVSIVINTEEVSLRAVVTDPNFKDVIMFGFEADGVKRIVSYFPFVEGPATARCENNTFVFEIEGGIQLNDKSHIQILRMVEEFGSNENGDLKSASTLTAIYTQSPETSTDKIICKKVK